MDLSRALETLAPPGINIVFHLHFGKWKTRLIYFNIETYADPTRDKT